MRSSKPLWFESPDAVRLHRRVVYRLLFKTVVFSSFSRRKHPFSVRKRLERTPKNTLLHPQTGCVDCWSTRLCFQASRDGNIRVPCGGGSDAFRFAFFVIEWVRGGLNFGKGGCEPSPRPRSTLTPLLRSTTPMPRLTRRRPFQVSRSFF